MKKFILIALFVCTAVPHASADITIFSGRKEPLNQTGYQSIYRGNRH